MQARETDLGKYEKLLNEFLRLEEASRENNNAELASRLGLQKIRIAREFAKIDESLLDISLKNDSNNSQFFSEILFLEAKRLRFKEEATKCVRTKTKKTKIKT